MRPSVYRLNFRHRPILIRICASLDEALAIAAIENRRHGARAWVLDVDQAYGEAFARCGCGCGQSTQPPAKTSAAQGRLTGVPAAFVVNHFATTRRLGYVVDDATGCWNYGGHVPPNRYGGVIANRRRYQAHRFFYEQAKGPIPAGLELDHLCRNTQCVNPDHLEPVTAAVNARRRPSTRLTPHGVEQLRRALADGAPLAPIARNLGIGYTAARSAAHGRTWRAA